MKAQFTVDEAPASAVAGTPEVRVLRVGGEIDSSNAAAFEALVAARAPSSAQTSPAQASPKGLVLDLSTVLYCDSAAFAALDRVLARGGVSVALGPGNPVHRAASIMGLPIFESVTSAARALRR